MHIHTASVHRNTLDIGRHDAASQATAFAHGHVPLAPVRPGSLQAGQTLPRQTQQTTTDALQVRQLPVLNIVDFAPGALLQEGGALPTGHEAATLILHARSPYCQRLRIALCRHPQDQDRGTVALRDGSLLQVKRTPEGMQGGCFVWQPVADHRLAGGAGNTAILQQEIAQALNVDAGLSDALILTVPLPGEEELYFSISDLQHSLQKQPDAAHAGRIVAQALNSLPATDPDDVLPASAMGGVTVETTFDVDGDPYVLSIETDTNFLVTRCEIDDKTGQSVFELEELDPEEIAHEETQLASDSASSSGAMSDVEPVLSDSGHQEERTVLLPSGRTVRYAVETFEAALQKADDPSAAYVALRQLEHVAHDDVNEDSTQQLSVDVNFSYRNQVYLLNMKADHRDCITELVVSDGNWKPVFSMTAASDSAAVPQKRLLKEADSSGAPSPSKARLHSPEPSPEPGGTTGQVAAADAAAGASTTPPPRMTPQKLIDGLRDSVESLSPSEQLMCYLGLYHRVPPAALLALKKADFDVTQRRIQASTGEIILDNAAMQAYGSLAVGHNDAPLFAQPAQASDVFTVGARLARLHRLDQFKGLPPLADGVPAARGVDPTQRGLVRNIKTFYRFARPAFRKRPQPDFVAAAEACGFITGSGFTKIAAYFKAGIKGTSEIGEHQVTQTEAVLSYYGDGEGRLRCNRSFTHPADQQGQVHTTRVSVLIDIDVEVTRLLMPTRAPYSFDSDLTATWDAQPDLRQLVRNIDWSGTPAQLVALSINPEQGEEVFADQPDIACYRNVLMYSGKEFNLFARVANGVIQAVSTRPETLLAASVPPSVTTTTSATAASTAASTASPSVAAATTPTREQLIATLVRHPNKTIHVRAAMHDTGKHRVTMADHQIALIRPHPVRADSMIYMGKLFFNQTRVAYQDPALAEAVIRAFVDAFPALLSANGKLPESVSATVQVQGTDYTVHCKVSRTGELSGLRIGGLPRKSPRQALAAALEQTITDVNCFTFAAQDRLMAWMLDSIPRITATDLNAFTRADVDLQRYKVKCPEGRRLPEVKLTEGSAVYRLFAAQLTARNTVGGNSAMLFRTMHGVEIGVQNLLRNCRRYLGYIDREALGPVTPAEDIQPPAATTAQTTQAATTAQTAQTTVSASRGKSSMRTSDPADSTRSLLITRTISSGASGTSSAGAVAGNQVTIAGRQPLRDPNATPADTGDADQVGEWSGGVAGAANRSTDRSTD